tara:strand:+ start:2064 stop:2729 length:666 start_codon:yes stop_codon:yes gene_type:complete
MSIKSWSYSRIKAFEQCPKQFYHLKVAKDYSEPVTSAMSYGTAFHRAAEEYVRDNKSLPDKFSYAQGGLDSLKAKPGDKLCEIKMGLTEDLDPCKFFDKNVWWRGIADLIILDGPLAWVVDYKTGKSARYADKGQLELMALAVFKHFPDVDTIKAGLVFFVARSLIKDTYTRDMMPVLWDKWLGNYKLMEAAHDSDTWNARPSGLCKRHCVVLECVHNGSN